jgi:signal transduction histidine kinase
MRYVMAGPWRNHAVDAIVVGAAVGLSFGASSVLKPYGGATIAVLLLVSVSLLLRRRFPLSVAWLTAATAVVLPLAELIAPGTLVRATIPLIPPDAPLAIPVLPPAAPFAAYSAVVFSRNRRSAWAVVVLLAALAVVTVPVFATVPVRQTPDSPGSSALGFRSFVLVAGAALLGLVILARRRLLQSYEERAERAERERFLLAEHARAEERSRLAAEMHDVVTDRVSHMVLQAGALRVVAPDEATRAVAEQLRATGCQALEELRDAVGLLRRGPDGAVSPTQPAQTVVTVPDLSPLIRESEAVGIVVEVVEEGSRTLAAPVVSRTAYRVVQEALTNVRKHAAGARVLVQLQYRPDGVHLTIRNTAASREPDPLLVAAGSGTGLLGLRQRVEMVNGALVAGPEPDGGYCVYATLPTYVPTVESLELM